MQINKNTFIVAGGASGLGEAVSRMIAANGGRVVIADVQSDQGELLARELGANARFVRCDVTNEARRQGARSRQHRRSARCAGSSTARASRSARRWSAKAGPACAGELRARDRHQPDRHVQRACASRPTRWWKRTPRPTASAACLHQHGVGRRLRRADRPGGVRGIARAASSA